jgi:hypothetical protein
MYSHIDPIEPVCNPVDLALPKADNVIGSPSLASTAEEEMLLHELDEIAETAGFLQSYYVETSNAYVIPADLDPDLSVRYHHFREGLFFRGTLSMFSVVKIGRILSAQATVRALCLTFGTAEFLPDFSRMNQEDLLYVPVLAIDAIEPVPNVT